MRPIIISGRCYKHPPFWLVLTGVGEESRNCWFKFLFFVATTQSDKQAKLCKLNAMHILATIEVASIVIA
jgi:hypothetical protein